MEHPCRDIEVCVAGMVATRPALAISCMCRNNLCKFFSLGVGGQNPLTDALLVLITFNSTSTIHILAAGSAKIADHEHSLPVHRISKLHCVTCC